MPPPVKAPVQAVLRHLQAGDSPKEIAAALGVSFKCIYKILETNRQARVAYIATYTLRYPHKTTPPPKIIEPLKMIVD